MPARRTQSPLAILYRIFIMRTHMGENDAKTWYGGSFESLVFANNKMIHGEIIGHDMGIPALAMPAKIARPPTIPLILHNVTDYENVWCEITGLMKKQVVEMKNLRVIQIPILLPVRAHPRLQAVRLFQRGHILQWLTQALPVHPLLPSHISDVRTRVKTILSQGDQRCFYLVGIAKLSHL